MSRIPQARTASSTNQSFPYGVPNAKPIGATKPTGTGVAGGGAADKGGAGKSLSSQKLNPHKCANPFQSNMKKCKTLFSQSYVSGSIPCRLQSSASRHSLQWDEAAKSGFSPDLLVVCADGLNETEHPYTLLAPMMFHELCLRSEGCVDMFETVIDSIALNLRKALMTEATFLPALNGLDVLMSQSGNLILPYLPKIVPTLAKGFNQKKHRERVAGTLSLMEQQCGPDASKIIKSKIPTY